MTSGSISPTPNNSPAMAQRPLLISQDIVPRIGKKTVEFQTDKDDNDFNDKRDK